MSADFVAYPTLPPTVQLARCIGRSLVITARPLLKVRLGLMDSFTYGILQALHTGAQNGFGLAVALLFVIEFYYPEGVGIGFNG
jgi:hypothetical protein